MPLQAREVILLLKRVGHCYGYPLNESHDDSYLKTLIILSHESDVAKRQALINRLISLEHGNLTQAEVEEENREIVQSIGAGFAEGSTMEFVPVVGMLVSVYNDFEYFHHLAEMHEELFRSGTCAIWRRFRRFHQLSRGPAKAL
jgi:hypothetical protein